MCVELNADRGELFREASTTGLQPWTVSCRYCILHASSLETCQATSVRSTTNRNGVLHVNLVKTTVSEFGISFIIQEINFSELWTISKPLMDEESTPKPMAKSICSIDSDIRCTR